MLPRGLISAANKQLHLSNIWCQQRPIKWNKIIDTHRPIVFSTCNLHGLLARQKEGKLFLSRPMNKLQQGLWQGLATRQEITLVAPKDLGHTYVLGEDTKDHIVVAFTKGAGHKGQFFVDTFGSKHLDGRTPSRSRPYMNSKMNPTISSVLFSNVGG